MSCGEGEGDVGMRLQLMTHVQMIPQILDGRRPPIPLDCPLRFTKVWTYIPYTSTRTNSFYLFSSSFLLLLFLLLQLMQDCWRNDPDLRPSWHVILTELEFILGDFQP